MNYQERRTARLKAEIEEMRVNTIEGIREIARKDFHARMAHGRSQLRKMALDIIHDPEQMEQIRKDEQEHPYKSYQSIIEAHQMKHARSLQHVQNERAAQALGYRYGG